MVQSHNPHEIIETLRGMIQSGKTSSVLDPYYNDYIGKINKIENGYEFVGNIDAVDDKKHPSVRITELPIGKWTADYKAFLDENMPGTEKGRKEGLWKDFVENHTDTTVDFTVVMNPDQRLKTSINISN